MIMASSLHGTCAQATPDVPRSTGATPDVPRSPPKPFITNGKRLDILMHSYVKLIISSISDKYHAQQMQLEVQRQAMAD